MNLIKLLKSKSAEDISAILGYDVIDIPDDYIPKVSDILITKKDIKSTSLALHVKKCTPLKIKDFGVEKILSVDIPILIFDFNDKLIHQVFTDLPSLRTKFLLKK